jgi:hypothetical protein
LPGRHKNTDKKVFELLRVVDEFVAKHGCTVAEACRRLGIKHYNYYKAKKFIATGRWHD